MLSNLSNAIDMLVSESSGIPIDREQIQSLVSKIVIKLSSSFNNERYLDKSIEDAGPTLYYETIDIIDAAGVGRRLFVELVVRPPTNSLNLITGAQFQIKRVGRALELIFSVIVDINGTYTWRELFKHEDSFRTSLTSTLAHEITHASDPFMMIDVKSKKAQRHQLSPSKDLGAYLNSPSEVRAYIASIREDIEEYKKIFKQSYGKEWEPKQALSNIRSNFTDFGEWLRTISHRYLDMSSKLTPENRNYILSKTYAYIFGGQQ